MEKINTECVIVGAGTYGQVYSAYLSEFYKIIGFFDDNLKIKNTVVNGYKVLGNIKELDIFINKNKSVNIFVTIGNNLIRVKLLSKFKKNGYSIPSFIHPSTNIHKTVSIGDAVYILPNTSIMPFTKIKDFVMISIGNNISHHTVLEKGVFLSLGTTIGALIVLKQKVFVGVSAIVMSGVSTVGKNTIIGAGTVVIKDIPDNVTVVGNPARIIKKN